MATKQKQQTVSKAVDLKSILGIVKAIIYLIVEIMKKL